MRYTLRPYQLNAVSAAMAEIRRSLEPCLIEAATGAGKSLLVADIAIKVHRLSGKHVLCLAPTKELIEQNYEKFLLTGEPASIYCAAVGKKDLRHPVIFGSPGTFKKVAKQVGSRIAVVIVDEAQGMTPTVRQIIADIKSVNPNVRVIGLTGTPYELGKGYIYRIDESGKVWGDDKAKDPFFMRKVYTISAPELIELGFLTPPVVGALGVVGYDTSGIDFTAAKKTVDEQIDRAFMGDGRKTAHIVADIVHQSQGKRGVMIFASTIQHAQEVMRSLPPELSRLVTGDPKITSKAYRKSAIDDFKAQKFKYLVNVAVLTTGFDAPHVDVIAILRKTESIGLLQQIIGRGLRLFDGKDYVLILDYAENIDAHCPDGDIFSPEVKASMGGTSGMPINCICPQCNSDNQFSARKNDEGHSIDKHGYFVDLAGDRVMVDTAEIDPATGQAKKLPLPAHFGRRCQMYHPARDGFSYQCSYRWSSKECPDPSCKADNDIAARYCTTCKGEIIDPNSKLRIEFKRMKKDATQMQTDEVLSAVGRASVSAKGVDQWVVDYVTPHRTFQIYYQPNVHSQARAAEWQRYLDATGDRSYEPDTVTYKKDQLSGFFRVYGYNSPADTDGIE
jgi:DNA repair protein RadD